VRSVLRLQEEVEDFGELWFWLAFISKDYCIDIAYTKPTGTPTPARAVSHMISAVSFTD
jgi:hypothetical protein